MTLHQRIKEIRKQHKLTQEEFGNKLGVTYGAISMLERGVNQISEQMVRSICREFGINRDWLVNGTEPKYQKEKPESAEALIPDLVDAISDYPVLIHELKKALAVMTDSDWKAFSDFVTRFTEYDK